MARTILITIQDNEAAELFARQMLASPEPPDYLAGLVEVPEGATIDAMVARPTKYCKCTPAQLRQGRHGPKIVRNWTRTPRFGWFVCSRCKRPSRIVVKNFIENHLTNLCDLLPELLPGREPANMDTRFMDTRAQEMAS